MPSKDDLSEQLALTTKLAAQVERMAAAADKLEGSYTQQSATLTQLAQALSQLNVQGTTQNMEALAGALKKVKGGLDETSRTGEATFKKLGKKVEESSKLFKDKFPKAVGAATGAISGLGQGMRNIISLGKGIAGFVTGFVDGLANIAASIIAIPIKIFSGLIDMAAQGAGGSNELMKALEDLRKEFGAFYGPTNKAIIDTSKSLTGFKDTGLSAWRVFGTMAERLEYIGELAKEMGGSFSKLREEMENNGGAILAYQKGLGIAKEDMKGVTMVSVSMGKKTSATLKDMTKYSYELGEAFGLDAKLISRDMSKALNDVGHFGGATVKQLGEASTYARKLGVELKDITGTLDAFDTFDTAAENAAKLSQAMGVQVDAFEMMKAQSPAEQVDMLRKAMAKGGQDASTWNRATLKLVASTTGLDEATAKAAFSTKNQGMSLEQIQKKSAMAEKKTLTQAEAMGKLADAIERLTPAGGSMEGGFWKMFVKGIGQGIMSSHEFVGLMQKIRIALRQVFLIGVQLGKALVQIVPGFKDIGTALNKLFDPKHITGLFEGIKDAVEKFFGKPGGDPKDPAKGSLPDLVLNLQRTFKHFFNLEGPGAHQLLDGVKKFMKFMSKLMHDGILLLAKGVASGARTIVDMLQGKTQIPGVGGAIEGGVGFLTEVLGPIVKALGEAWKIMAPALWELIKELGKHFVEFLKKHSDTIAAMAKPVLGGLAAMLFGPAFGRAIVGAIAGGLAKSATGAITGGIGKLLKGLVGKASKVEEMASEATGGGAGAPGMQKVGAVNKATSEAVQAGKGWGVKDAVAMGLKLVAIAGALAIGGMMMAAAIVQMKKTLNDGGIKGLKDIVAPIAVLGAMVLAAIPLMFALKLAAKAGSIGDVLKGGLIISAAVGIVGLVGAGLAYVMTKAGTPAELEAAGNLMLKMSLVFLAMVPLIFASMVIGALASGPQALALAAAAIGMGVIAGAVAEMAVTVMAIVKELNKMKIDGAFQRKVDAFLGIMKAIQAFADTLVKLIGLMTPSFTEFITGTAEKFTDKVKAAQGLIKDMIGTRGGGGGIIGIVEIVMDSIKQLNIGGPGMAESAKVFSEVLTAVTETIKAMTPPDAFFEAGDSFMSHMSSGKPFTDLATDVGYYAKVMREGMMEMLTGNRDGKGQDGVLGIIRNLSTFTLTPEQIKASEVIGSLLQGVSGIMKNIAPNPETIKAFETSVEQSAFWGAAKTKVTKLNTGAIVEVMNTMGQQFQTLIPMLTGGIIKSVVEQVKGLDPKQLEGVKIMADLLKVVVSLTQAMGDVAKGASTTTGEIKEGAIVTIINQVPSLTTMMQGLQDTIGPLMNSMKAIVKDMPNDKDFMKNLETTKTLFGFVGEIPKLASSLQGINGAGGDIGNTDPLLKSVVAMAQFLQRLVSGGEGPAITSPMTDLIKAIESIGKLGVAGAGEKLLKITDTMGKLFQGVNTSANNFSAMQTNVARATTDITTKGIETSLKAVSDMVAASNELDKILGGLNKNIDVKARMEALAKAVGIGQKVNYQINPSRYVQLNINLQVTMDAGEVEKVMILRKNSIISERIDFATGKDTHGQAVQNPLSGYSRDNPPGSPVAAST